MAKHPFADLARQQLEVNGIVFNADGTTSKRDDVTNKQEQTAPQGEPENKTTVVVTQTTPPAEQGATNTSVPEDQNTVLEMYRKRNAELEAQLANKATTTEPSAREIELERELNELRGKVATQTQAQQADAVRELLERKGFDSENVDDDVLIEIRDTFVKPVYDRMLTLEQRLSQTEQRVREPTPEEKQVALKNETQNKIFKAIPDFGVIFNSAEFQKKLSEPDSRYPFKATYGHALQDALESGNADFIVDEVKAFISGKAPTMNSIADVGATNGVGKTTPGIQDDGFTYTPQEAVEMLRKRQRRELTAQEYSEYRAKLDAKRHSVQK